MRHGGELPFHRLPDVRMVVAVAGSPPRRDAVDQFATVGEHDAAAFGARHRQRRPRELHLRVGQPDRIVTGDHPRYAELEQRLARLKGTQASCVFGSGYLANAGIAPALVGRGDLILIDELAHSSLWTGARLSRAKVLSFRHNAAGHVAD